jgi:hypothetical protein
LPPDVDTIEAHLEGQDELAADDHAWAVPPARGKATVNLVSLGNHFLETVFNLMPNIKLSVNQSLGYSDTDYQLTIFDSVIPTTTAPGGNLLFIAPPDSTELFSVTGMVLTPTLAPVAAADPLLNHVDMRNVAVQDAVGIALPAWGRPVLIDNETGAPLLIIGKQNARYIGILAFDLRRSDLPLRVAFPILMANLLDALIPGGASGIPANVEPGRALDIPAPLQAESLSVRAPDGTEHPLSPVDGHAIFEQTNALGVYEVKFKLPTGSELAGRFAVNLFSPTESDITPRETLPIASAALAQEQVLPRARDEWWRPIAWVALGILGLEWLLSHRGQLAKVLMVNR